jgi:transcriptional regulator
MGAMTTTSVYCFFFDGYETLDAMGPIEFLHRVPDVRMRYISVAGASENGGSSVKSAQGFTLKTEIVESLPPGSILLIPGGIGTRSLVMNDLFLQNLAKLVQQSQTCLTVCTGAALLAATGVLDGKPATTNKRAFEWGGGGGPPRTGGMAAEGALGEHREVLYILGSFGRYGHDSRFYRRPVGFGNGSRDRVPLRISMAE